MRRAEKIKYLSPDKSIVMPLAALTIMSVAFLLVNGSHVSGKTLARLPGKKIAIPRWPSGSHVVLLFRRLFVSISKYSINKEKTK